MTAVRLAVLKQVGARPHADVETIFRAVDNQLGSVSRQAVYDTLRSLAAANLVRRVEPAGSPARYETRVVRQPPPRRLPGLRRDRRRRLRGRLGSLPGTLPAARFRPRRGRGDLLGPVPALPVRDRHPPARALPAALR